MSVRLKVALVVTCLWSTLSCAADNYSTNPAAVALVYELVVEQGFDREQLLQVFGHRCPVLGTVITHFLRQLVIKKLMIP